MHSFFRSRTTNSQYRNAPDSAESSQHERPTQHDVPGASNRQHTRNPNLPPIGIRVAGINNREFVPKNLTDQQFAQSLVEWLEVVPLDEKPHLEKAAIDLIDFYRMNERHLPREIYHRHSLKIDLKTHQNVPYKVQTFPNCMQYMKHLYRFNLGFNATSCSMPTNLPASLRVMTMRNALSYRAPPSLNRAWMFHQYNLRDVHIQNCGLTELPKFSDTLRTLIAKGNRLTEFPIIKNWPSLVTLDLNDNYIESLPEKFLENKLRSKKSELTIDLSNNKITSLPKNPGKSNSWLELYIGMNPLLDGELNRASSQKNYRNVTLRDDCATAPLPDNSPPPPPSAPPRQRPKTPPQAAPPPPAPESVFYATLIQWAGEVTAEMSNRVDAMNRIRCAFEDKSTSLDLDNLGLSNLPSCLSELTTLKDLSLNNNQLTHLPSLPTALTSFSANDNKLYGLPSLPANLSMLDVENNQLTNLPTLPASLEYLGVGHNRLNRLPALPMKMSTLNVNHNNLTSLPVALEASLAGGTLNVSHNPWPQYLIDRINALPSSIRVIYTDAPPEPEPAPPPPPQPESMPRGRQSARPAPTVPEQSNEAPKYQGERIDMKSVRNFSADEWEAKLTTMRSDGLSIREIKAWIAAYRDQINHGNTESGEAFDRSYSHIVKGEVSDSETTRAYIGLIIAFKSLVRDAAAGT
ncbi:MAG: leucine-rich repeat domain-containing protein [Pseudomonadota bacterium]